MRCMYHVSVLVQELYFWDPTDDVRHCSLLFTVMTVRTWAQKQIKRILLAKLMIYSIESHSFRKFLLPTKQPSRTLSWYRFWQKIATRILPGKQDCRGSFLETLLNRIWINLFEYILRRRCLQIEMGFRRPFTYSESLKIYRGLLHGVLRVALKTSPRLASECSFTYVSLLMHFLGENTGLKMRSMKLPMHSNPLSFRSRPGILSYQPLENRVLLLHAALQAAPSYLQDKPLNLNICWSCSKTTKCFHCSQCRIVRYCSGACAKADWDYHRLVCASLTDFVLASPLGRKLYKCVKKIDTAEPVYFCEVLEYVAHRAASRSVRRLEAKQRLSVLHKLLEDLLNEDLA